MKQIIIESRTYSLETLNPAEIIRWSTRVISVLGPALGGVLEAVREGGEPGKAFREAFASFNDDKAASVLEDALKRAITPENEYLRDPVVFNKWFQQYPGDIMELSIRAVWELSKDFFPQRLASMAQASQLAGLIRPKQ